MVTSLNIFYLENKTIIYHISFFFFFGCTGLHCCMWAFSSCGQWGLLYVAVCGASHYGGFSCCKGWALGMQASVVAACRPQSTRASVVVACGLSSCGARAQLPHSMWVLHGPGIEPMSPTWAGGFLTTGPPGKFKTITSLFQFSNSPITERLQACSCTLYSIFFPFFFQFY